jgi:DNA-binding MarR family transcriptional regulator
MSTTAEPRWLNREEQGAWRAYLQATKLLFDQLDHELQRDAGIPHSYYEVLVVLSESPERRMRMAELADRLLWSRSRLSPAVNKLEEIGWVRRDECPTDQRGLFAVLTDEGFDALRDAAPGHVDGVRTHLFDQLSPAQVRQLRRISEAIGGHLRDLRQP